MSKKIKYGRIVAIGAALAVVVIVAMMGGLRTVSHHIMSRPGVTPDDSIYPVRGIDISAHNGDDIDFERVMADGYSFVIIKATEGTDFKDRNFASNYLNARRAGMKVGAYHFFRFDTDGALQAVNFLNSLRGRRLDLPAVIDVEEWGNPDGTATSQIVSRLRQMIERLEHYDVDVVLYTNKDSYDRYIKGNFADYPLWLCTFSDPDATADWQLWQYSHSGYVDGIRGKVDLNTIKSDFLR